MGNQRLRYYSTTVHHIESEKISHANISSIRRPWTSHLIPLSCESTEQLGPGSDRRFFIRFQLLDQSYFRVEIIPLWVDRVIWTTVLICFGKRWRTRSYAAQQYEIRFSVTYEPAMLMGREFAHTLVTWRSQSRSRVCSLAWLSLCDSMSRISHDLIGFDVSSEYETWSFRVSYRRVYNGVVMVDCYVKRSVFGRSSMDSYVAVAMIAGYG